MKKKAKFLDPITLLVTFFKIGNIKYTPGSFGSLAAVFLYILYNNFFNYFHYTRRVSDVFWMAFLTLLFFVGSNAINVYTGRAKKKDRKEIVIDEVLGQLLVLFSTYHLVSDWIYIYHSHNVLMVYGIYYTLAFALFRIFDVWKPLYIDEIQRRFPNGYGIMLDDIVAGVLTAVTLNLVVIVLIYTVNPVYK